MAEKRYEAMCPVCRRALDRELGLRTETERVQHVIMASLARDIMAWWEPNKGRMVLNAEGKEESLFFARPKFVELADRLMKIESPNFERLIDKLPAALGGVAAGIRPQGGRKPDQNSEYRRKETGRKLP